MASISSLAPPINGHAVFDGADDAPPPTTSPTAPSLLAHHLQELRASGLSDETIAEAGIYSVTSAEEVARLLGWPRPNRQINCGIAFPFYAADGSLLLTRIKPDRPRILRGKTVKYESPVAQPNEIYVPRQAWSQVNDASHPLLITEGEKKTLALHQCGYASAGLVGASGARVRGSDALHPSLAALPLRRRDIKIALDSDAAQNPDIQRAEQWLLERLQAAGANVLVLRLPEAALAADGTRQKVGVDDFLVENGIAAFDKLIADQTANRNLGGASPGLRKHASELDPGEIAERFLAWNNESGLSTFANYRGGFWGWRQGRYEQLSHSRLRQMIVRFLRPQASFVLPRHIEAVQMHLADQAAISDDLDPPFWIGTPPRDWDPRDLITLREHVIHSPSAGLNLENRLPATPALFTLTSLGFDLSLDAPPPTRWLEFLQSLWDDSPECISLLQEWMGYCLTADTRQQKILLLLGPTRSGKGTICRVLEALVGAGNHCSPTLASLGSQFGLQPLIGKSLALIADVRIARNGNVTSLVERLLSISGEDQHTIHRKFLDALTMRLTTRLIIASNEMPHLHDSSGALASRFLILPMTRTFVGREDVALASALIPELPGILRWALEGLWRLNVTRRFVEPPQAMLHRTDLREISSPIRTFIEEYCDVTPAGVVSIGELYAAFREWAAGAGRQPSSRERFGSDLRAAFPEVTSRQRRIPGRDRRTRDYHGIRLLDAETAFAGTTPVSGNSSTPVTGRGTSGPTPATDP